MLTLLKQEFFKSWKQNRVYIWLILSFIVPFITFKIDPSFQEVAYLGFGTIVAYLATIIFTAITFTQEFSYGTIRPLLSRRFSRGMVFTSKVIVNFINYLLMMLVAFIASMIALPLFVQGLTGSMYNQMWPVLGSILLSDVYSIFFVGGLVLLISNIVKSSGAAIGLGVFMLIGTTILDLVSSYLTSLWEPFKWNPFQLQEVVDYLGRYGFTNWGILNKSVGQTFAGGIWSIMIVQAVYIIVIYLIAYYIFRKRSV